MVDGDRIKNFEIFNPNKCDPIILGVRVDNNFKYEIIDGQHRMTLFKNINMSNNLLDEYIPVDVRICHCDEDIKSYIDSANNRRNFSSEQLRTYKYPLLHDLLNKEFQNNLFRLRIPYIKEEDFKTQIFKTKFFEDYNNTSYIISEKIKKINIFLKNIDDKSKLSTTKDMTKKS